MNLNEALCVCESASPRLFSFKRLHVCVCVCVCVRLFADGIIYTLARRVPERFRV